MKKSRISISFIFPLVFFILFLTHNIFAQDDPCVPAYVLSTCGDNEQCQREEARRLDEQIAKCRAERNKGKNSTGTDNSNTSTFTKTTEDNIRAEREAREHARLEDDRRTRERTNAFNEQKARERRCPSGATCAGRAEISDGETNERTRAFNQQKRKQKARGN